MPSWLVALFLSIGATAWIYNKLARANGNANPQSNLIMALIAGAIIWLVMFTLMRMILNFDAPL